MEEKLYLNTNPVANTYDNIRSQVFGKVEGILTLKSNEQWDDVRVGRVVIEAGARWATGPADRGRGAPPEPRYTYTGSGSGSGSRSVKK